MLAHPIAQQVELWPIDRFIPYARNPRKNDAAVDRMAASILREAELACCLETEMAIHNLPRAAREDGS